MARLDYYAILGVARDADEAEIKRAYRRVALESHPDRFPDDEDAHERFREASEAYEVLSDSSKRARYDSSRLLPESLDLTKPPNVATARDLFANMFGDMFGNRRQERRKGRDIRYTLTVELARPAMAAAPLPTDAQRPSAPTARAAARSSPGDCSVGAASVVAATGSG
jgi:molecular chaperone DnaJ